MQPTNDGGPYEATDAPGRGPISGASQRSFKDNQWHGEVARSVFTRYLVAGLRDGSAGLDGDGNITLRRAGQLP